MHVGPAFIMKDKYFKEGQLTANFYLENRGKVGFFLRYKNS